VKVLKDNRRAIVTAAAHAQRAVDYLAMRAARLRSQP
jgi:antirestriction protein ArdC